jgi:hypothetical protein
MKRRSAATRQKGPVSRRKVSVVMQEYKDGDLKSSSGQSVTNPKQAQAIALSEGRRVLKKK